MPSIRVRLIALCGGLIALACFVVVATNYGLVASSLIVNTPELRQRVERELRLPRGILLPSPRRASSLPGPLPHISFDRDGGLAIDRGQRPDVSVARVLDEFEAELRTDVMSGLLTRSLLALVLLVLASIAIAALVARRLLRPVQEITDTAQRLSDRNLHERIAMSGPRDELKDLADTFDSMLARLDGAFQSQRRFVANASHELRTPLAVTRTQIEVTDRAADRDELWRTIRVAEVMTHRNEQLLDSLLTLARSQGPLRTEVVALGATVREARERVEDEALRRGIDLEVVVDNGSVIGDPPLLERLMINLLENAVVHNVPRGWVGVTVEHRGEVVRVDVANSGPMVPAESISSLFEPFRRLAPERTGSEKGSGLGLSIVKAIAEAHGGGVSARPRSEGGLVVTVTLPADVERQRARLGRASVTSNPY